MTRKTKTLYALNKDGSYQEWYAELAGNSFTVFFGKKDGKIRKKTTICSGKNIGRSNETTNDQQAELEMESAYRDQIRKGYKEDISALVIDTTSPMLAADASKKPKSVVYPCDVMTKLDGCHILVTFDGQGLPVFNSRGGKEYPKHKHLVDQLCLLHNKTGIESFDGECYIHGFTLQNIMSLVKKVQEGSEKLEYHIFDIPSDLIWQSEQDGPDRKTALSFVQDIIITNKDSFPSLTVVDTETVSNQEEAKAKIGQFMEDGYEGIIIHNYRGKYEFGQRSNDLLKWKLFQDAETKVVSVTEDKNGEGVLNCQLPNGITHSLKMKGTHAYRSYKNMLTLVGKWVNFTYQQLTEDGVPQFAVGQSIRNCDDNGKPLE